MEAGILFVMVMALLFLGVPIAVALGLSSIILIAFFSTDSMSSVALQLLNSSQNYTLLAIPFFILASAFMSTGGVARRITRDRRGDRHHRYRRHAPGWLHQGIRSRRHL